MPLKLSHAVDVNNIGASAKYGYRWVRFNSTMERTERIKHVAHRAVMDSWQMELKPEQLKAIVEFVCGLDVFVLLPTSYGKCMYRLLQSYHSIDVMPVRGGLLWSAVLLNSVG